MRDEVACAISGSGPVPCETQARSLYALRVPTQPRAIEAYGRSLSIAGWAAVCGCSESSLRKRLSQFPPEVAIALPYYVHVDATALPGGPMSWTWDLLLWEDDEWAQGFVQKHPGGASLEAVGAALGIGKERVRQVEEVAMRKFQQAAAQFGIAFEDLLEALLCRLASDEADEERVP